MSTPTRGTAPGITKLTAALQGFLTTYALPDPAMVTLDVPSAAVRIQPHVTAWTDPVAVLSTLLLWARALTGVTATWHRYTPSGDNEERLYVSIHGRLSSGIEVNVYKSLPYLAVCEWVCLHPDHEESVSLDELAWLIGQLHTARPAV
jgi:hypothetical protein